jgi:hypothetical protein
MVLLVKDANNTTQSLSTQSDIAGALVVAHVPATVVAGIATPISGTNPMPVEPVAGAPAIDGSGSISLGGTAQTLFGGITPVNGFLVANNAASDTLYISDVSTAIAGGASIPIKPGTVFATPPGYKPAGPVSIYGATTADAYAARRW